MQSRVKAITDSVVEALQKVVIEHEITEDELHAAAHFLDNVGVAEGGKFAELFDIFLSMTSLEALQKRTGGTMPSLEGPFYFPNAPIREDGVLYEQKPGPTAQLITVFGTVTEADTGAPIPGAIVDVWQSDEHGIYDNTGWNLRGRVITDDQGNYRVETILPFRYKIRDDGPNGELLQMLGQHSWRPAHIHFKVWTDDKLRLTSQFYVRGTDYLDTDVADAVREELIFAEPTKTEDGLEVELDLSLGRIV